jgi:hypothetical protein
LCDRGAGVADRFALVVASCEQACGTIGPVVDGGECCQPVEAVGVERPQTMLGADPQRGVVQLERGIGIVGLGKVSLRFSDVDL